MKRVSRAKDTNPPNFGIFVLCGDLFIAYSILLYYTYLFLSEGAKDALIFSKVITKAGH